MKVFVYGTLKSGYGNNRLLEGHTFVGSFVVNGFKLYNYGFPAAKEDENSKVRGEIWDIGDDQHTLRRLDGLESEGYMYHRKEVDVVDFEEKAFMYVGEDKVFHFDPSRECPINDQGEYEWSRKK